MLTDQPKRPASETCPQCWKPPTLCLCESLKPYDNLLAFLVLQHPQESRNPFGTARLLSLGLQNGVHRVGLSWRSLSAALRQQVNPERWAVLHLGTRKDSRKHSDKKSGQPAQELEGLVILDGNWKQSKALWWRNPWLNRLPRIVLAPNQRSRYGEFRRQPRGESLCTLESAIAGLKELGESEQTISHLDAIMDGFLDKLRSAEKSGDLSHHRANRLAEGQRDTGSRGIEMPSAP